MVAVLLLVLLLLNRHDPASSAGGGSVHNAALYKPAYQSSLHDNHYAYLGNDGNNTDIFAAGHCQHTLFQDTPWWMVDLMGQFKIEKLVLTNRAEGSDRLKNFAIDIFKTDPRQLPSFPSATGQICYSQIAPLTNGTFTWQCPAPIVGRFVRLVMFAQDYLHICELEVYVSDVFYKESSFRMKLNRMLKMTPFMTVNVDGVMACSQQCSSHRENDVKCTAFNWFAVTGECQLFQVDPNNIPVPLVVQAGCNFVSERT
ncbi:unnamed protein product [Lymnaea stagnalis]|uniref:Apple domain-containing protein n=1 Tax=Lymnaea stagnalis TaxID=6523 RepID=A0AAV2HDW7_LYMST